MSTNQIQSLNADLTNDRIEMPYPHIFIKVPNDAVALVLPELSADDIPVLCTYKGTTRQLTKIRRSAIAIRTLSRVTDIEYVKDNMTRKALNTTTDIMEVLR